MEVGLSGDQSLDVDWLLICYWFFFGRPHSGNEFSVRKNSFLSPYLVSGKGKYRLK